MRSADSVLIVVDVQNDFCPGGTLAVPKGDEVVPIINRLAASFSNVVLSQDWHPAGHTSFASSHTGKTAFETMPVAYGIQILWPDHCIQGTSGAEFHPDLTIPHAQMIVRKGYRSDVDSYSCFLEADRKTPTGLAGYLRERGLRKLYLAGLATDFCVLWTALDARRHGFETTVIEDACRGIDLNGSIAKAWDEMRAAGVAHVVSSTF